MAFNIITPGRVYSATSLTFASTIKSAFVKRSLSLTTTTGFASSPSHFLRRGFHGGRIVAMGSSAPESVNKPEEEWRAILSPEQFRILRQKGTEYPGTGEYNKLFDDGIYCCAGCGTPLYKSTTKFDSGCGWPAFFDGLPGAINRTMEDESRSHVQLVEDISVMFLKEKVSLLLPMSDTV
ncbi:peptide methionine sulfoxide reductase B2, chloroplastic isoform X2 [Arabidopsis lyrata subsp. lyrata]|uniref:peptide methionine sulfoxide reductase B2, chloroplastic isoform X2 n=1 Tax=Arabidopsis lyrata subsp. lyrata TaxID=81972 RepID=UPI000A29CA7A|nr:peptide methionine sulfoxide reductase B2, chloroplastic isoform X2 [Arabidopsis lyrata subsp. lyrata]|eukprot:XP_020873760.1 peptide methionine sulfoxide reductase B2, chloroplastic isoform X2 [Arabidopsis lyrata subsp. lyrata]